MPADDPEVSPSGGKKENNAKWKQESVQSKEEVAITGVCLTFFNLHFFKGINCLNNPVMTYCSVLTCRGEMCDKKRMRDENKD